MKKNLRALRKIIVMILVLSIVLPYIPVQEAKADSYSHIMPTWDQSGPPGNVTLEPVGASVALPMANINVVAVDAYTGAVVPNVGAALTSDTPGASFDRTAVTSAKKAGVFSNVPVNLISGRSEQIKFKIGSVDRNYKHPGNAAMLMDLYAGTPDFDALEQSLINDGMYKTLANLVAKALKYAVSTLKNLHLGRFSVIIDNLMSAFLPEKVNRRIEDPYTRQPLFTEIRYKDYSLVTPGKTKYWIQVALEPKMCDSLTIVVPGTDPDAVYSLRGPGDTTYRLYPEYKNGETYLICPDSLPMGTYFFTDSDGHEHGFSIQGISFPTTADGSPDYRAFQNMLPLEQAILKKHGETHYNKYYAADPGNSGQGDYFLKANDWTMITSSGLSLYGSLMPEDPTAVEDHVLRLTTPQSCKAVLIKAWVGGDAPDTPVRFVMGKYDYDNSKTYLDLPLDAITSDPELMQRNRALIPTSGNTADASGHTYISIDPENFMIHKAVQNGVTYWEALIALPLSLYSEPWFYFAEEDGIAGWTSVSGSGVYYDVYNNLSYPSLTIVNMKDPVTFKFRKVDINGQPLPEDDLPEFVIGQNVLSGEFEQSTVNLPVSHDNSGLYSVALSKGAEYTLVEYVTREGYEDGAVWTVSVSDSGEITVEPKSSAAPEVTVASDGIFEVPNRYENPQTFHLYTMWTDATGRSIDPPEGVEAIAARLIVEDASTFERYTDVEITLRKEDEWTCDYVSRVPATTVLAHLAEEEWLDKDGNHINEASGWYLSGLRAFAEADADTSDVTLIIYHHTLSVGFVKLDGAEISKKYHFKNLTTDTDVLWDDSRECYLLETVPWRDGGTYILAEYDEDNNLLGHWDFEFDQGLLRDVTPDGFTVGTGQTEPSAEIVTLGIGEHRAILRNPADTYEVNLRKEWDPTFTTYDKTGKLQEDHRAQEVTFIFTPVGIGSSLEDMKPLPDACVPETVYTTVNKYDNYMGSISLVKNVIYVMTEQHPQDPDFKSVPYYKVEDLDGGNVKTEWILPNGTVYSGSHGAVITEEDADKVAVVRNSHDTFTVNVHLNRPASDNDKLPEYVTVELQKKTDGKWVEAQVKDVKLSNPSGEVLNDISYVFQDIDADAEYRARVRLKTDGSPDYTLAEKDTECVVREDHGYPYKDGDGTSYQVAYDDSQNALKVQKINLNAMVTVTAQVCWMDANDRDKIRPDKVTVELLEEKKTVGEDGEPASEWVPVTGKNGTVTAEVTGWKKLDDTVDYGTAEFKLESYERKNYRVRVVTDKREKDIVRFDKDGSVYQESYQDEANPRVILTAKKEYKVEKKWDTDIENLDKPDKLTVILQRQPKDTSESDWGEPVQALSLSGDNDWKGTFKPVDRYVRTEKSGKYQWEDGEAVYRVRECKTAPLKGKLSEYLGGLEESVIDGLGLPDFITDFVKDLLPDSDESEQKIYDWICNAGKDTPAAGTLRKLLKDSVPEDGEYISLTVPRYFSPIAGKYVDEHTTKYKVFYKEDGNTTTITNLAVEDVTIWKVWVGVDRDEQPDDVYLILTSKVRSEFADYAAELGIPLVNDYTPVINPVEGELVTLDLLVTEWKVPLTLTKVKKPDDPDTKAWKAKFVVKKYGESGLPQEFRGYEGISYVTSEAAKLFFGSFLGPVSKVFEYAGFNFLDTYLSVSLPAVSMPELGVQIGSALGHDEVEGLHSAVINTWIHDDSDDTPFIGGAKIWKDDNNKDGLRPDRVDIRIYETDDSGNGTQIAKIAVEASENWLWSYSSKHLDTEKHSYYVVEDAVPGYSATYDGLNIINTYIQTPGKNDIAGVTVVKDWNGDAPEDIDGVTVYLMKDGTVMSEVELTGPDWSYTFTGLDLKDKNGSKIEYSVKEAEIPGYRLDSVSADEEQKPGLVDDVTEDGDVIKVPVTVTEYTFTLKNKPDPDAKALFRVIKEWENDDPANRPAEVKVTVTADTGAFSEELTLTAAEDWTAEIDVPLRTADGGLIGYAVEEVIETPGYSADIGDVGTKNEDGRTVYECTVTNTWGGKPEELNARFVLNLRQSERRRLQGRALRHQGPAGRHGLCLPGHVRQRGVRLFRQFLQRHKGHRRPRGNLPYRLCPPERGGTLQIHLHFLQKVEHGRHTQPHAEVCALLCQWQYLPSGIPAPEAAGRGKGPVRVLFPDR